MKEILSGSTARYCKPSSLNESKNPSPAAFQRRPERKEGYLSLYLLDYFKKETELENVRSVQLEMARKGFIVKKSGVFAILDIEKSKDFLLENYSEEITFREANLPHCGLFHESDDLLISELLIECIDNSYKISDL